MSARGTSAAAEEVVSVMRTSLTKEVVTWVALPALSSRMRRSISSRAVLLWQAPMVSPSTVST